MLSVQQHQQQQFVPDVDTIENNFRTTEKDEDFYFFSQHLNLPGLLIDEQEEEYPADYFNPPTNFEIANRAFYATINKFTRQSCPDASRRRSPPYSFLENWHLHSIYSKSQQTLLGITPVRPSVLLSGDDFMFTPPFIQQENQQEECCIMTDNDQDWNQLEETKSEFYNLSPCPDSNGTTTAGAIYADDDVLFETSTSNHDKPFADYYNRHSQENIWLENDQRTHNLNVFNSHHLPIHIQQNDDLLLLQHDQVIEEEEEEEELYTTDSSSSDEQRCISEDEEDTSCYNIANLYDLEEDVIKQDVVQPISPMTRSSSFLSQKSSSSSVMSYQSLADIMSNNMNCFEERSNNNYGSTNNYNNPQLPIADSIEHRNNYARNYDDDLEMGAQHNVRTTWTDSFIYFIYIWQFLVLWVNRIIPCIRNEQEEREPLL